MRPNKKQIMERLKEWEVNYKEDDKKVVNNEIVKAIGKLEKDNKLSSQSIYTILS